MIAARSEHRPSAGNSASEVVSTSRITAPRATGASGTVPMSSRVTVASAVELAARAWVGGVAAARPWS